MADPNGDSLYRRRQPKPNNLHSDRDDRPKAGPGEVEAITRLAEEIGTTIDGLPEEVTGKRAEYFESVAQKAEDIAETVRRTGRVTEGQRRALENMLEGVRAWEN